MGAVARAMLDNGGKVTGVIPRFLTDMEGTYDDVTELVITDDMHDLGILGGLPDVGELAVNMYVAEADASGQQGRYRVFTCGHGCLGEGASLRILERDDASGETRRAYQPVAESEPS